MIQFTSAIYVSRWGIEKHLKRLFSY